MANLSGLGSFAEGLAGGINQGLRFKIANREMDIREDENKRRAEQYKEEQSYKQEYMDLQRFDKAFKVLGMFKKSEDKANFAMQQAKSTPNAGDKAFWETYAQSEQEDSDFLEKTLSEMSKAKDIKNPQERMETMGLYRNMLITKFGADHPTVLQYLRGDAGKAVTKLRQANELILRQEPIDTPEEQQLISERDMYMDTIIQSGQKDLIEMMSKDMQDMNGYFKEQAKPETKPKLTRNVVKDSNSPTGWSYTDDQGKIMATNAPDPFSLRKAGKSETNVTVGLTKATQTDLEKQQMDAEQNIMSFDEIEKLTKDSFLTYPGQGMAMAQKYSDKAGFKNSTDFLEKRTAWMQQAKSTFLAYRKWITGVAGGEKEMAEIAKSFPDPEKNSPAEFRANLKQARSWRKKVNNWVKHTRAQGLSISDTPENIKAKHKANANVSLQDMSDDELLELLGE